MELINIQHPEDRTGFRAAVLQGLGRGQGLFFPRRFEALADVPDLEVMDLTDAGVEYTPLEEELEPYDTFEQNARSKAVYFHAKSGLPTVAVMMLYEEGHFHLSDPISRFIPGFKHETQVTRPPSLW